MKFTKFIAASFVALTMFSCSKEAMDDNNGPVLNPGDARIVWSLNNGATTYATAAQEKAIKSIQWALYDFEGNKVDATNADPSSLTSLDIRVSASVVNHYITLGQKVVSLHILINSDQSMPATLTEYKALVVKQSLKNADVETKGIVARFSLGITLSLDNVQNISGYKMPSGAARFGVIAGGAATRTDIVGAKITLKDINSGFQPFGNAGVAPVTNSETYEIGATVPTDYFGTAEAAVYAYPTNSGASIEVELGGQTKTIPVGKIEPNKNYIITIIPDVQAGKTVVGSITIAEFVEGNSDEYGVRFAGEDLQSFVDGLASTSSDITFEKGGWIRFAKNTDAAFEYALADLFKDENFADVKFTGIVDGIYTYATSMEQVSKDGLLKATVGNDGKLKIERNFNSHKTAKYEIKLSCSNGKTYIVKFIINGAGQPENLFVNMNGIEIMTVGVNASADANYYPTLIANIEKQSGSTFAEQTKAYINAVNTSSTNAFNGTLSNATDMLQDDVFKKCPEGSEVPSMDQLLKVFFNSTDQELPAIFTQGTGAGNRILYTPGESQYGVTIFEAKGASKNYWSVSSSNGKMLYLTGSVNIVSSSQHEVSTGNFAYKRLVFWSAANDIQHRASNTGSTLRCVKKEKKF